MIHPTAVVNENAVIGKDCKIGPFCIIGPDVVLGDRVELISNVVVDGKTSIGDDSAIYPFAVIGVIGQDLKWQEESAMTGLTVGKRCRIREYVTINSGTPASDGTVIGNDCQIMINSHVGHDCKLGNGIVMSNLVQLAGHVEVEDNVILSGGVLVHQFVRIGRNTIIGGMSGVSNDALPYAVYNGARAVYRTINRVGLMRHGFTKDDMHAIHSVYSAVFRNSEGTVSDRLSKVRKDVKGNKYAMDAIDFIENRSKRGIGTSKDADAK